MFKELQHISRIWIEFSQSLQIMFVKIKFEVTNTKLTYLLNSTEIVSATGPLFVL